jgi:hypothetical protein
MLDFNRANISSTNINTSINAVLDAAALAEEREARRPYLGASGIGSECLRKVQWDWQRDSTYPARTKRIFSRGHMFEEITVKAMAQAGFRMERGTARTHFSAVDGLFRGHADGILIEGPLFLKYPAVWEHKCLGSSGWKKIEKSGLKVAYPVYYDQVVLYQAYLDLTDNPALFTAVNADTCEILHLPVTFDAEAAQAASDRAVSVIKAVQNRELMPRVATKPDDWRCKMCSHRAECWAVE